MRKSLFVLFISLILPSLIFSQRKMTPEDFLRLDYPRDLAVSPDGDRIVYTITRPDFEESEWRTQLHLHRPGPRKDRQLTFTGADNFDPEFSPDGHWLTFLSEREPVRSPDSAEAAETQIWAMPMDGGEAQQWTGSPTSVRDYKWNPAGGELFYLAEAPKPDSIRERMHRMEKRGMNETVKDSVKTNRVLYSLSVKSGHIRTIATLDPGVGEFSVSPDGGWIVYETNYTGEYNDAQEYDLWAVSAAQGSTFRLTNHPGPETDPRFSPDGTRISFTVQTTPDIEFAETDLAWFRFRPKKSAGQIDTLTLDYNRAVTDHLWLDDSQMILQTAEGMETPILRFRPRKKSDRYIRLTPDGGNASHLARSRKDNRLFYLWEDRTHIPEIARLKNGEQKILSEFSDQVRNYETGTIRRYAWKSAGGEQIEGLLFLPPDFQGERSYPMVLTVHGGPYSRFRNEYHQYYLPQMYTSDDYIVFAPNPRGSAGYGDAFGKAIWHEKGGHMGGIDYRDIMAGVDSLVSQGYVDSSRMGVVGGSYGGYMTNWIISQNNRFEAAVSMYGIFSLFTDWSNSWQPAWEKMYLGLYYWERPINRDHPYVKYSPAFYVENIHTPALIMHGTDDKYTNLSNSQEMYQALKTLGREVKFVVYPGEGHGLSDEPNHRLNVLRRSKRWFDNHLKK